MAKAKSEKIVFYGTGRRKSSIARVRLVEGTGKITINGKDINDYLNTDVLRTLAKQPFAVSGTEGKFDTIVKVEGGGLSGQAGAIRHGIARALVKADESLKAEIKKAGQQELTRARNMVGAKREPIKITDREWEAIQAGAISESKLKQIITHTDIDNLRERAMPRNTTTLSEAKINKINSMRASGYSTSEIAESIGYSVSTVNKYLS